MVQMSRLVFICDLSKIWKNIITKFYLSLIKIFESRLIIEFLVYLNEKHSSNLAFSIFFVLIFVDLESILSNFKKQKYERSDNCLICKQFYKRLKFHFSTCFNRISKEF